MFLARIILENLKRTQISTFSSTVFCSFSLHLGALKTFSLNFQSEHKNIFSPRINLHFWMISILNETAFHVGRLFICRVNGSVKSFFPFHQTFFFFFLFSEKPCDKDLRKDLESPKGFLKYFILDIEENL